MFADDTAVIASSRQTWLAYDKIGGHLQTLIPYFQKWELKINIAKFELINFSHKNKHYVLKRIKIDNQAIPEKSII